MSSFLDQSQLLDLAERLVSAARRAGADAADAVAVRSISQSVDVRDGAVEESQRAEGDDMGLRVLVGKRQAVVSTNDVRGNGADALAERAVAMARVAPEDQFAGLADATLLAHDFPDLDLVDPALPDVGAKERRRGDADQLRRRDFTHAAAVDRDHGVNIEWRYAVLPAAPPFAGGDRQFRSTDQAAARH
jgi:PmbA protein